MSQNEQQSKFELFSESNPGLHWFCFATLCDWLKKNSRHILILFNYNAANSQMQVLRVKLVITELSL